MTPAVLDVLTGVKEAMSEVLPPAGNPVMGSVVEAVHEKVEFVTLEKRLMLCVAEPEQTVIGETGEAVTVGFGLTVISTFNV